jgi:hypothetical protein
LEKCPNGGALVLHVYQDELRNLSAEDMTKFVSEYFDFVYGENPEGVAHCVMGIVHRSAVYMPDFIDYFADKYPTLLKGDLGMSAVGTICSPGRDHKIGPSLLKFLCIPAAIDRSPQGITAFRKAFLFTTYIY